MLLRSPVSSPGPNRSTRNRVVMSSWSKGRVVLQGVVQVQHHRQDFVVHLNQLKGLLGHVGIGGCHGGHGMAPVQYLALRQDVLRDDAGVLVGVFVIDIGPLCWTMGKSLAVATAITPGSASALLVSMLRMRAWAWGLRRTLP